MRDESMQRNRFEIARTWLRTSAEDLSVARTLCVSSPSRSAFHAQQAAECALKSAVIALSDDHQRTHSLRVLLRDLSSLGERVPEAISRDALALELFYTSTRYPDSVNDGDPSDFVDEPTALVAIERAERIIDYTTAIVECAARDVTT